MCVYVCVCVHVCVCVCTCVCAHVCVHVCVCGLDRLTEFTYLDQMGHCSRFVILSNIALTDITSDCFIENIDILLQGLIRVTSRSSYRQLLGWVLVLCLMLYLPLNLIPRAVFCVQHSRRCFNYYVQGNTHHRMNHKGFKAIVHQPDIYLYRLEGDIDSIYRYFAMADLGGSSHATFGNPKTLKLCYV